MDSDLPAIYTALTTALQIIDDNLLGDKIKDDLADGSAGFMNMRRPTLKETIKYTKEKYGKELMPQMLPIE